MINNPEVGDIIYILDSNSHSLIPHQVIEKVITKTLHGENVHRVIRSPRGKSFRLEDCNHRWFSGLDEAKIHLLEAAAKFVETTALKAKQIERVFESPKSNSGSDENNIYDHSSHDEEFNEDHLEDSDH